MRILCLNTWNYHDWKERKPKIISLLQRVDADIVLLQEINDDPRYNSPGNNIAQQLNAVLKYPHIEVVFNSTIDKSVKPELGAVVYRQGLAILSKTPIAHVRHHLLHQEPDDKFKRGLLLARVQNLEIVNLHFSNRSAWARKHWAETLGIAKGKPLFAGDFNFRKGELHLLEIPGYTSPYHMQEYTSYPPDNECYDHMLVPDAWEIVHFSCLPDAVSDHKALLLELKAKKHP